MKVEDQYLRKMLDSPDALLHVERLTPSVNDGMRKLRWAVLDCLQVGAFSALALTAPYHSELSWHYLQTSAPLVLVAAIIAAFIRNCSKTHFFSKETTYSLMRRSAIGALMTFVAVAAFGYPAWPDPWVGFQWVGLCAPISVLLSMALTMWLVRWSPHTGKGTDTVAVIGDPDATRLVSRVLDEGRWPGWTASMQVNSVNPDEVEQLRTSVASGAIDVVIIAVDGAADRVRKIMSALPDSTARICIALNVPQPIDSEVFIWLVNLWRNPHEGIPGATKRVIDVVLSASALLVLTPLMTLAALMIRLESPGPVLFRQWRFGASSRPFQMFKFRTMRVDVGDDKGAERTIANDPRVTRVGRIMRRTSLDELPQLFNVLIGDMSLVGPRAQALYMHIEGELMFEALTDYPSRHRVLPGITGWAQVNGSRGEVDTIEKAQRRTALDLWYIRNWTLWLDLLIIVRTILGGFMTLDAD